MNWRWIIGYWIWGLLAVPSLWVAGTNGTWTEIVLIAAGVMGGQQVVEAWAEEGDKSCRPR